MSDIISKYDEQNLKYNFVFLFAKEDYWKAILGKELYESEHVHVLKNAFIGNTILQLLFKMHWSYRINRIINLPFKSIWFKRIYKQKFQYDLPLCFVYMGGNNIRYDGGFTDYVRKMSPKNKQVIYHGDLISKKCKYDYELIRKKVDLATTYDQREANIYGIHYFRETTYSKIIPYYKVNEYEQDIYFLGAAKDRFDKIISVYKRLYGNGVKCRFLISGVEPDKRYISEGIEYIDRISYVDNIKNVLKSKCILELIQGESSDITLRAREAIAYRRKLLTDCTACDEDFFNQSQLQKFANPEDIDLNFFMHDYDDSDFEPRLDMNPFKRLYDLQDALEEINV